MKWAQFKKKLNINVPAGQGDELNCKKQQHFIISILKNYQKPYYFVNISRAHSKNETKKNIHIINYTCTELHTCFETFVMIITFSLSF